VIFADAVPAVAKSPPAVIPTAKSAAMTLRFMLPPFTRLVLNACSSHDQSDERPLRNQEEVGCVTEAATSANVVT
jgi:hypothetical protein